MIDAISKPLPNQGMTEIERLEELAVKWVSMNSLPISLEDVSLYYKSPEYPKMNRGLSSRQTK